MNFVRSPIAFDGNGAGGKGHGFGANFDDKGAVVADGRGPSSVFDIAFGEAHDLSYGEIVFSVSVHDGAGGAVEQGVEAVHNVRRQLIS